MGKNLLITGATGFVGRNLLLSAIRSGAYESIHVPVRSPEKLQAQLTEDGFEAIPSNVVPVVGSASDWKLNRSMSFDDVVHSAAILSARTREEYRQTNIGGALALLSQVGHPKGIVILSSQAASGPCAHDRASKSEDDRDEPLTWYGESKLAMETETLERYSHLNLIFLRLPMILGPRDQATLQLFKLVKHPFHLKPGFRDKTLSFISVTDLVQAVESVLRQSEKWAELRLRRYFVASGDACTDRDLISTAAEVSGRRGVIVPVPNPILRAVSRVIDAIPSLRAAVPNLSRDRVRELRSDRWVVSPKNFEDAFGWRASDDLRTALKSTHDWYRKTGQI
jgi:nucleoside-diphosphate-sugar epimerase